MRSKKIVVGLALISGMAAGTAQARDIGLSEAVRLANAGTVMPFDKLDAAAIALHPGATVKNTELERRSTGYVYELELRTQQGQEWDVELDAVTGKVLENIQDQ